MWYCSRPTIAKATEGAVEKVGEQVLEKGEALLTSLWSRWAGEPESKAVLAAYVDDPQANEGNLQAQLALDLKGDPKFAEALKALIDGGSPTAFQRQFVGEADFVSGPEVVRQAKGYVEQHQIVLKGTTILGPKIGTVG